MFCKNCGKEIDDNASVCIHCGVPTANAQQQEKAETPTGKTNGLAIAGFVLSFFYFVAVIGLILSIVGFQKSKLPEYEGKGKKLAIAGIVISCVMIVLVIVTLATCGTCAAGIAKSCNDAVDQIEPVGALLQLLV